MPQWWNLLGLGQLISLPLRPGIHRFALPDERRRLFDQAVLQRRTVPRSCQRLPMHLQARIRRKGLQLGSERVLEQTVPQWRHLPRPCQRLQVRVPARIYWPAVRTGEEFYRAHGARQCFKTERRWSGGFFICRPDRPHRHHLDGCTAHCCCLLRRHCLPQAPATEGTDAVRRRSTSSKRAERRSLNQQEDGQDGQVPRGAPHHQRTRLPFIDCQRRQSHQRARVCGRADKGPFFAPRPAPAAATTAAAVQCPPYEQSAQCGLAVLQQQ